jgi:hypothetical protein
MPDEAAAEYTEEVVNSYKADRKQWIRSVIDKHRGKDFVDRIIDPSTHKPITNEDGSISTHSMAWGEANGKFRVFPTVAKYGAGLKRFEGKAAWRLANELGNYIEFDTAEEADRFSKEYKTYWEK